MKNKQARSIRFLASPRRGPMKTGGRLVKHVRYYWLLPAEGHLNRALFKVMLGRIRELR